MNQNYRYVEILKIMKKILPLFFALAIIFACNPVQKEQTTEKHASGVIQQIDIVNNGNVNFDYYFKNKTMRLDYFHTGNSETEHFATDKILSDGEWYGSRKLLID
ncbi:MAG: hypothetical protein C0597_05730 [Marinilabiliales bacterium]|nr:MAG: hypothetical protein C0597_05730 [Marinilabiliales bacterium]